MNAYHHRTDTGFTATTFASSIEEAVTAFCVHHETMMDAWPGDFTTDVIERMKTPLQQRHLEEALFDGQHGVGYYLPGRGWTVAPSDMPMTLTEDHSFWTDEIGIGTGAPIRLYRIFNDAFEIFVFAHHISQACDIATEWAKSQGITETEVAIDPEWAEERINSEADHLGKALATRVTGTGTYDGERGWSIKEWSTRQ